MAAFFGTSMLWSFALLSVRQQALWPHWLGWAAATAGLCYSLRIGVLFSVDGVFAADGTLGLFVPVVALTTWLAVASISLTLRLYREGPAGLSTGGGATGGPR